MHAMECYCVSDVNVMGNFGENKLLLLYDSSGRVEHYL